VNKLLDSSQQGLCYLKGGLQPFVKEEFITAFQPGSIPQQPLNINEINDIKGMFILTMEQLETEIQTDLFLNYTSWTNRFNIEMTGSRDVLCYLPSMMGYIVIELLYINALFGNKISLSSLEFWHRIFSPTLCYYL